MYRKSLESFDKLIEDYRKQIDTFEECLIEYKSLKETEPYQELVATTNRIKFRLSSIKKERDTIADLQNEYGNESD